MTPAIKGQRKGLNLHTVHVLSESLFVQGAEDCRLECHFKCGHLAA